VARNGLALLLAALDFALFAIGQVLVVSGGSVFWMALGATASWIAIVRLFVIGHDACHGSLTNSGGLNKVIGRLAFLPSLTTFSLWRVGHNVVHHGFNNLKGRDFVWAPLDPQEYSALSSGAQRLQRLYRSAWGPAVYYLIEMYWKRLWFPNAEHRPAQRREFTVDSWLVTAFVACWALWLALAAGQGGLEVATAIAWGLVVPYALWLWTMGLVIYVHHTHPDIPWFANKGQWRKYNAQVRATEHIQTPIVINYLLHHILDHQAHHLDAGIPLYNLTAAQRVVAGYYPDLPVQRWTLSAYLDCVRRCKLYDFAGQKWLPFP
jgi:omega-6 fatty acid desaturase (delta-12 desaturase)